MELWFPGAKKIGRPSNNTMSHSSGVERITLHTSQGATGPGTAESTLQYTLGRGIEYSMAYDVHSDEVVQCHPWTDGARALLNAGLPGGGANRNGKVNFQLMITGDTAHMDEMIRQGMGKKLRRIFEWAHANGIPLVAPNHGDSRNLDNWLHKSGWYSHGNTPGQDHTDGRNDWSFLKDIGGHEKITTTRTQHPGKQPTDDHGEPTYTVTVLVGGKQMKILNRDGTDENWTIHPDEAKEYPDGHIHLHRVDSAVAWAEANHFPLVKVLKYTPEKHPDHKDRGPDHQGGTKAGGGGHLTLRPGARWPDDPELMSKLKAVAEDLGKEVRVISGLRTRAEQEHLYYGWTHHLPGFNLAAAPGTSAHEQRGKGRGAADVNVVTDKGLVSIGNYPGGYAACRKHGLHFSATGEPWHLGAGSQPDRWHP